MYPFSPKRVVRSDISTAATLEQSLGAAYELADEKISQFSLLRDSVRPIGIREKKNSSMSAARPSSAPRGRAVPRSEELYTNPPSAADRRFESMVRRLKALEDRCKKSDTDIVETSKAVNDHASLIDQLLDGQTTEKKTLHVIRENIGSLKSQVEILSHKDDILERTLQRPTGTHLTQNIDVEAIQEIVFQRVKDEFSKVVQEVVKSCASEQANFLSKWAEWNPANIDATQRDHDVTTTQSGSVLNTIEKDVVKLKAEAVRMKMRVDALETGHHNLRNAVKSSGLEETQKRLLSAHKAEVQSMLDSVGRRVNEVMMSEPALNKDVYEKVRDLEARIAETSANFSSRVQLLDAEQRDLRKQILRADGLNESKEETLTKASVELMKFEIEKKLASLTADVEAHKVDSKKAISSLSDSNKKVRSKVNELTLSLSSFSQTRKAVELLLQEVDTKAHADASWSYQFKAAAQKIETRVLALETKTTVIEKEVKETESAIRAATEVKLAAIENRMDKTESSLREYVEQSRIQALANISTNRISSVDQQVTALLNTLSSNISSLDLRLAAVEVSADSVLSLTSRVNSMAASSTANTATARDLDARLLQLEGKLGASTHKEVSTDGRVLSLEQRASKTESEVSECLGFVRNPAPLPPPPPPPVNNIYVDPQLSEKVAFVSSNLQVLDSKVLAIERHIEALRVTANEARSIDSNPVPPHTSSGATTSTTSSGATIRLAPEPESSSSTAVNSFVSAITHSPAAATVGGSARNSTQDPTKSVPSNVTPSEAPTIANKVAIPRSSTVVEETPSSNSSSSSRITLAAKHSSHRRKFIHEFCESTPGATADSTAAAVHNKRQHREAHILLSEKKERHRLRFIESIVRNHL